MARRTIRRIPATEVKTHFGRIVEEVVASKTPVVIQTRGRDQAAIISLSDLSLLLSPEQGERAQPRERARGALRAAGLLSEPPPELIRQAEKYEAHHAPEVQERILSDLRSLHLEPSLSDVILQSRDWPQASERTRKR